MYAHIHIYMCVCMYLFMVVLGLHCCTHAFSSCGEWGLLSSYSAWSSHCGGFSCGAQALGCMGFSTLSVVAADWLQGTGLVWYQLRAKRWRSCNSLGTSVFKTTLQGAWVPCLAGELIPCMLHCVAKSRKIKKRQGGNLDIVMGW